MLGIYLIFVPMIVVIQETLELNPEIEKYDKWIKDAETSVKRIKAVENRRVEYEMNEDPYIHDKREADSVDITISQEVKNDQIHSLRSAAEFIDVQFELLENIIILLGQVDVAISTLGQKKSSNATISDRKKNTLVHEKLKDIKVHANYLVHQEVNLLKTMLNFMFPVIESEFPAENGQQIAKELFQHMTECKFFFFNYLHRAYYDLAHNLAIPLSQNDTANWEKITSLSEKKCQENIAKLSTHYKTFNRSDQVSQNNSSSLQN